MQFVGYVSDATAEEVGSVVELNTEYRTWRDGQRLAFGDFSCYSQIHRNITAGRLLQSVYQNCSYGVNLSTTVYI